MSTCLRISEAAALALHTVGMMAKSPETLVSNQEIASSLHVSEHHLAKVHQRLVKAGLARAVRGPHGGFQLLRDASTITLMEIVEAVEGPFHPDRCLLGRPKCQRETCILGRISASINEQVGEFLRTTTADTLVGEG